MNDVTRPPLAAGDPSPVWPLLDLRPRFAPDSFMRPRGKKTPRYHAGVDMPAPRGTVVVAPESGRVIKLQTFNGPNAHALLMESDATGITINLGEVEPGSWSEFGVDKGSKIFAGQPVARVGINPEGGEMLHFETYAPGTRKTSSWYVGEPPPPSLLDPTDYVLRAAARPVTSQGVPLGPELPPAPLPGPSPAPAPRPAPGSSPTSWPSSSWIVPVVIGLGVWWLRRGR